MKPARLAVLAVAIVAGCGAALLMSGEEKPPAPVVRVEPAPQIPLAEVLVAAADLPMGQTLKAEDLRWMPWPEQALSPTYVERKAAPKGLEDAVGSIVRTPFSASEPIRPERLVKAGSGFMSAILPPGMRAVAITIDNRGSSAAGGFILPNDRVDVIKTARDESGNGNDQFAETLFTDIRVLAVGQIVQEKGGQNVVTADTATLALTPSQAEAVTLAQKVGQLSLVLRSVQDAGQTATVADAEPEGAMTVVRFGVAKQQRR
ncbi:Flp pilus assembly protein CpaB [Methylorubrum salsuginis]|uniref:Pilus assembly protein CpaB n=1 Tax=Methylorubrum salsuginis TaxID=414703 RepID=A0A1I4L281_9HYPH|nr:Flp pilus assembly protein CpaB [Methylorubrum salsuginis]SFL85031.1 pilus assembly protein CpaB [Methylorubrum salsuginis]